ncbi:MAG: OmpA family protein, partial [Treponema sp.]|nr:OmpA family protein [Treponema sp.]
MKKSFVAFTLIFISAAVFSQSAVKKNYDVSKGKVKLEFKYKKDDSFRILSTVNENVYQNKSLHHFATIINRITSRVTDVNEDGSAVLECNFMTSESSTKVSGGNPFVYGEDY